MVYDPIQKTLLVDKGEIRVGSDYQAEIPPYIDPGKANITQELCKIWSLAKNTYSTMILFDTCM